MASENLNVRITGELRDYLSQQISPNGLYENASEYMRDLIRRDYERKQNTQQKHWQWLTDELAQGFYADENNLRKISAADVIKRNS